MSRPDHAALRAYLDAIGPTPRLSADEERELAGRVAQGDPEARDRLAHANLRLVVTVARDYLGRGPAFEDLVAEGNLGLLRAVEGYDGRAGVRFGTYAAYWIKQSIRRLVINQGAFIRLPAYAVTLLAKWRRAEVALADRLGRDPTAQEVGQWLGLSGRKLAVAREAVRAQGLVRRGAEAGDGTSVLDGAAPEPSGGDARGRLSDAEDLDQVLGRLGAMEVREATIVRLRFGLGDEPPLTLREVGERLGLTRERVRQLERVALETLAGA